MTRPWLVLVAGLCLPSFAAKERSMFYPEHLVARVRANCEASDWGRQVKAKLVAGAGPWLRRSDDELWDLVFGPRITRAWMVWSDGFCPACRQSVPMYRWEMNALQQPWKVACPHCHARFPTNDFAAYHRSGLDGRGVFDPALANRELLVNEAHPAAGDPLRGFGVDDGEGYLADGHRWRFIGAWLIYGQWKQLMVGGVRNLAAAYVVTGDQAYAHKAAILLDRIADVYPEFDFQKQGTVYEQPGHAGYVSTWHDAAEEHRELVLAYDQIVEALADDRELVAFLSAKATRSGLANPKASAADIRRNIEDRIFRDAIANRRKIESNYPQTDVTLTFSKAILDPDSSADEVRADIDRIVAKATAVDGVTGEKGLTGYASYGIHGLTKFVAMFDRGDPEFLPKLIERHPKLRRTWRFMVDNWSFGRFYPEIGDGGSVARVYPVYAGVQLLTRPEDGPQLLQVASAATLLWRLYQLTGDEAYCQVLYNLNQNRTEGLPYDLFSAEPEAVRHDVAEVVARAGPIPASGSVNLTEWCLAHLRTGQGGDGRAVWLDYDAGGGHGHQDGLNLGLFAKGLDLLPDYGYPPVQYGGWGSPRAGWYRCTAAHNTVLVDHRSQPSGRGETTLWAVGRRFRAVRVDAPALNQGRRYQRTVALIDTGEADSYVIDLVRVAGGHDHAWLLHSTFGTATAAGLSLSPADGFDLAGQWRGFRSDPSPTPGWTVEVAVDDLRKLLPAGTDVRLRYHGLTPGAEVLLGESWVSHNGFSVNDEAWLPQIVVRRRAEGELDSTFVGVIEPYQDQPLLTSARRLALTDGAGTALGDSQVAIAVALADGREDLLVARDPQARTPLPVRPAGWSVETAADLTFVRRGPGGPVRAALAGGGATIDGWVLLAQGYSEFEWRDGQPVVVAGEAAAVERAGG